MWISSITMNGSSKGFLMLPKFLSAISSTWSEFRRKAGSTTIIFLIAWLSQGEYLAEMGLQLHLVMLSNRSIRLIFYCLLRKGEFSSQNSQQMQPSDHTSALKLQPESLMSSGDMQRGVPTLEQASSVPEPNTLPRPKSPILRLPSWWMKMLAGFRSRCMIFFSCMCLRAPAICFMYSQMTGSSKGISSAVCSRMSLLRSPLSAHSQTMQSSLFSTKESMYLMMLGWSRGFMSSTSLRHLSRSFWSDMSKIYNIERGTLIFLMAKGTLSSFSALYTQENLPSPIDLMNLYPLTTCPTMSPLLLIQISIVISSEFKQQLQSHYINNSQSHSMAHRQQPSTFMEDLEESLIKDEKRNLGIDEFEAIYSKKKIVNQALDHEKGIKQQTKENLNRIKQRVYQIEQLNERVNKQAALMKNQYEKITEAHNVSKILMMEKIVKLQRETEDLERKRNQYYQSKAERQRSSVIHQTNLIKKIERSRMNSFCTSKALKDELSQNKFQTLELNRQRADSIKADKERRKFKAKKIEEFKQERARKNYFHKMESLKHHIDDKGSELRELLNEELKQEKHAEATNHVTTEYLHSFFATETL